MIVRKQNQGKMIFEILQWPFKLAAPVSQTGFNVNLALKRTIYSSNFCPNFVSIHRAKYQFPRNFFVHRYNKTEYHSVQRCRKIKNPKEPSETLWNPKEPQIP